MFRWTSIILAELEIITAVQLRRGISGAQELNERIPDGEFSGQKFLVSKFYTLSLNEKATLRKDLQSWRGKSFTEKELAGFDIENLIGANCTINIIEGQKADGLTMCNFMSLIVDFDGNVYYNSMDDSHSNIKLPDSLKDNTENKEELHSHHRTAE